VSRRVGNAVARNRVKRRVREWFRREKRRLDAGRDYVVIARPGAAALPARELWAELEGLVQ
jgi:ribonuclease P protein component